MPRAGQRIGGFNGTEMTSEEIAAELGVTRQCVDQILRKAMVKVRRELTARGLTLGDLAIGSLRGCSSAGTASDLGELR